MPGIMTYLESADSTRVTYDALRHDDQNAKTEADKAEIQLFLEMVAALAMGRQIIVPQSFAFDSYIFQRAAVRVWKAFEQADVRDEPPIRLHLFNATTFEESVVKNISRTKEGENAFHSSLFPELNSNLKEWDVDPADGSRGILRALPDGDPRKNLFLQTLIHFEYSTPNPFARPSKYGTLSQQIKEVIDGETLAGDPVLRNIVRSACEKLQLSRYHLTARSDLRSPGPWPGSHDGQSAKKLIGDENLTILTEVVDTLYNKTVAWTTGARYQIYSTRLAQIGRSLHRTGLAQSAAVDAGHSSSTDNGTACDIRFKSSQPLNQKVIGNFLSKIQNNNELSTGLTSLFQARADDASEFRNSLRELSHATDPTLRTKLLREHVDIVARTLGHGYEPKPSNLASAGIGLGLTAAATAGDFVINPPSNLFGALTLAAIAVGGAATSLNAPLKTVYERQKITRRAERAIGSILREDS